MPREPPESVVAPDAAAEVKHGAPWRVPRPAWELSAAALVVILAGLAYLVRWHSSANPATPKRAMLAVLPFQNLSDDPEQEYFSDGLTEETITDLGRLSPEHLGVIARTSAMAYKHTNKTVIQIGHELVDCRGAIITRLRICCYGQRSEPLLTQ
ncbi:MAG: hypothetical protein ABSE28_00920 [Candidatus Sulfotelmatobacter sp.]